MLWEILVGLYDFWFLTINPNTLIVCKVAWELFISKLLLSIRQIMKPFANMNFDLSILFWSLVSFYLQTDLVSNSIGRIFFAFMFRVLDDLMGNIFFCELHNLRLWLTLHFLLIWIPFSIFLFFSNKKEPFLILLIRSKSIGLCLKEVPPRAFLILLVLHALRTQAWTLMEIQHWFSSSSPCFHPW